MTHITIIGGGITGLATAFYLQQKSKNQDIKYTLIESKAEFGGKISTNSVDGFIMEGGPDSFITQKPWGTQLCHELGLADRLIPTNDDRRNIFVLQKGKLIRFPGGYRLTVPTQFIPFITTPLISTWGKLRMAMELVIPPRKEKGDESLADFIRRRLGAEALDKIGGPIMAGIYVANPERLSLESTFPMFAIMERKHGSLIKAMGKAGRKRRAVSNGGNNNRSKPPPMFTSLRGGMGELVESLVEQLDGELLTNCQVTGLQYLSPGFKISTNNSRTINTDTVILATPAYIAASLLEPTNPQLAQKLNQIRYVSTATVSLAYHLIDTAQQHDLNGFGFMIPKSENRNILACTWSSTKFSYRTPKYGVLLRVFIGGEGKEHLLELSDEKLLALVRAEIADIMKLTAEPVNYKIFRWPKGNPQYDVGHLDRIAAIEAEAAKIPGLYLAGSAFRGIGIPNCIQSAITTVDNIITKQEKNINV